MFLCLGHWGRGCGLEAHLPATALRGRLQIKLARVQQEMQVRLRASGGDHRGPRVEQGEGRTDALDLLRTSFGATRSVLIVEEDDVCKLHLIEQQVRNTPVVLLTHTLLFTPLKKSPCGGQIPAERLAVHHADARVQSSKVDSLRQVGLGPSGFVDVMMRTWL
jgi:hypothetical protein